MVRLSLMLSRVPVIRFRKGNKGAAPPPASSSSLGACPMVKQTRAAAAAAPQTADMSTCAVPDIMLPARYKRAPLTQEEIDHINGGGIV